MQNLGGFSRFLKIAGFMHGQSVNVANVAQEAEVWPVTFNWATADGTATTAGSDYTTNSGTATIAAGQTILTLPSVATATATGAELAEYFSVTLSNLNGAYIDGSFSASNPASYILPSEDFTIGRYRSMPGSYFPGKISEITYYNRALSLGEVQARRTQAGY